MKVIDKAEVNQTDQGLVVKLSRDKEVVSEYLCLGQAEEFISGEMWKSILAGLSCTLDVPTDELTKANIHPTDLGSHDKVLKDAVLLTRDNPEHLVVAVQLAYSLGRLRERKPE